MEKIKFRLALEGGGAKIFAHIAALEAVKALPIQVSAIAGVSAGAIAAGFFSADINVECIKEVVAQEKYADLAEKFGRAGLWTEFKILRKIQRSKPLRNGDRFRELLSEIVQKGNKGKNKTFGDIARPTFVTATNIVTRKNARFNRYQTPEHDLVTAMLASANLPFVFFGRNIIGPMQLLDGGLFCNIPVDELEKFAKTAEGAHTAGDPIIAFVFEDESQDSIPATIKEFLLSVVDTMLSAPTRRLIEIGNPHVEIIKLNCNGVKTFDFDQARRILAEGSGEKRFKSVYESVHQQLEKIIPRRRSTGSVQYLEVNNAVSTADRIASYMTGSPYGQNESGSYSFIDVEYTDITEVSQLRLALREACKKILHPMDEERVLPEFDPDLRLDALKRPELAIANETVYSFPFFLTPVRRSSWGVIPYARHWALGIVMSKNSMFWTGLKDLSYENNEKRYGRPEWLNILLKIAKREAGSIFCTDGYIYNEMVPLLIASARDKDKQTLQTDFIAVVRSIDGVKKEKSGIGPTGQKAGYKFDINRTVLDELQSGKSAIVFDLADCHLMKETLPKECAILTFAHDLNIPVGVGFSLPIANYIRREDRWKQLALAAHEILKPARPKLMNAGLELLEFTDLLAGLPFPGGVHA